MLVLALPRLEPAHPAGVWTGQRFRKCCRGFPVSTCGFPISACGFPNSCSSSWCWVCGFPSAKTQCQPQSCCFSKRKILLLFLKISSADSKFPSPSPVLGVKDLGWILLFPGTAPTGILGMHLNVPPVALQDQGTGGTAKGHSPGSTTRAGG